MGRYEANRERILWYKQHGICYWCGHEDAVIAGLCGECYENYKRCYTHYQEQNREIVNARNREIRARRKAAGLCVDCGKPAIPGRTKCRQCAERAAKRCRRSYWQHRVGKSPEQCAWCDQPKVPGYQVCEEHLEAARKRMKNARAHVDTKNHPWVAMNNQLFGRK